MKYIISLAMCLMTILLSIQNIYGADSNTVSSSTVTGTTTVDRTPSTASAPNIIINNQDVCTSGISGAAQSAWFGISMGKTIKDENCERLKLARSLYGMGMKVASVTLLCQDIRVFKAMMMAGTPCPIDGKIGEAAKVLWDEDPRRRPDYDEWKQISKNKEKVREMETYKNDEPVDWDEGLY